MDEMDKPTRDALVDLLYEARSDARQVVLPPSLTPQTRDAGIAIHNLVARRLASSGWEPLGYKIAGTTPAMSSKLGVAEPIYGRTFRKHAYVSPTTLEIDQLLDPLVECEFFVTLGKDLPFRKEPWTFEEIVDAVATVHAGIEVAECRYPMKQLPGTPGILADGSAAGRYIYGDEIKDWKSSLADMEVVLEIDGKPRRRGKGTDVLGHPLNPIVWLANERQRWGDGIKQNEMISTGSMTGMFHMKGGGHSVRAVYGGGQATVQVSFERGVNKGNDVSICSMVRI